MHGLYLLWWVQEKGISPATVAVLLAATDLAIVVLEVPTGWCADRFGHRLSLIVGSCLQVAGMVCCWLGQGIPGLVAGGGLIAVGDAFRSGADQALLYRSCVAVDREAAFQTLEARARAVQQVAMVGLVLVGGALVEEWGFATGWIAETLLCASGLLIACAMVEPPQHLHYGRTVPASVLAARATDRQASRREPNPSGRTFLALIAPAALLGGMASAASFLVQTAGGRDAAELTVLVAAITLAEAAGSAVASRVPAAGFRVQAMLGAIGLATIGFGFAAPSIFPGVVVLQAFLLGIAHPLRAAAIQRLASDDVRARVASMASACDMACNTIAGVLAGVWRRRTG